MVCNTCSGNYVGQSQAEENEVDSESFTEHEQTKFIVDKDILEFPGYNKKLIETNKIQIRREYFTNDMAKEFIGKDFLFICDIRISNDQKKNYKPSEKEVKNDMMVQQTWVEIMKPRYSILKFRLPWEDKDFLYLDGKIIIQPWGPQSSTETRLIVSNPLKKKKWSCKSYEEQMFYFNTVTRCQFYEHGIVTTGIDNCYDCATEIYIIKNYLKKFNPEKNNKKYNQRFRFNTIVPKIINNIYKKFHIILVVKQKLTSFAKKALLKNDDIYIEIFLENELYFNVTKRNIVPKHILLSEKEQEEFIKCKGKKIPKILETDPICRYYNANRGDIFKILRDNDLTYRIVIRNIR